MSEVKENTEAPKKGKRDVLADGNNQARLRAGKRSSARHAGKENTDEGLTETLGDEKTPLEKDPTVPDSSESKSLEDVAAEKGTSKGGMVDGYAEGGDVKVPAPTSGEGEGDDLPKPTEEATGSSASQAKDEPKTAIEQFAKEESQEPQHQEKFVPAGEYQAPEGPSHEELIDQYHEALMYGDKDKANELYKHLQEHRFQENKHRGKTEADEDEYLKHAQELAAKHPELGEDGLAADKVHALAEVYRNAGHHPIHALHKAVEDLHGGAEKPKEGFEDGGAVQPQGKKSLAEDPSPKNPDQDDKTKDNLADAPADAYENQPDSKEGLGDSEANEEHTMLPNMDERNLTKRKIASIPNATARNEVAPEEKKDTRLDAIKRLKAARGQA